MSVPTEATALWAQSTVDARFDALPDSVVAQVKRNVLDACANAIAGSRADGIDGVHRLQNEFGGAPETLVLGFGDRLPAPAAAFMNGTMAHALDFDDTLDEGPTHVSSSVVPAALACAERRGGVGGQELITAIAYGEELMCRLALALEETPFITGWHPAATQGYFGSALAASKVLGLDETRTLDALGIAYSQSSGNTQCIMDGEGALSKRLQVGFAAQGGVLAALLAEKGLTGARKSLEGKYGLYNVYHRGLYDRSMVVDEIGERFELMGLSFKITPACRATQYFIDPALQLVRDHGITPDRIAAIRLFVPNEEFFLTAPLDIRRTPRQTVHAQFSAIYTVAVSVLRGNPTIGNFTPDGITDPEVLAMTSRISASPDPALAAAFAEGNMLGSSGGYANHPAVEITTVDGAVHTSRPLVNGAKGGPDNPVGWTELADKFRDCAQNAAVPVDERAVERVISVVADLENVRDVAEVIDALTAASGAVTVQ
ncbi:MmgE/PrpD family protein [Tsukamurella sp. NPDC003166]|uniref:MmgE/PrpD family protein n=1 Tax=Tsukamurella sp. NPDC003166 TaxID=3154444 RepID=UPI0033BCE7C0